MMVVRDYNVIIQTADNDRDLFTEHVETLDSIIKKGTESFYWNNKKVEQSFVITARKQCALVYSKVKTF